MSLHIHVTQFSPASCCFFFFFMFNIFLNIAYCPQACSVLLGQFCDISI
jgi:hypothetical protein